MRAQEANPPAADSGFSLSVQVASCSPGCPIQLRAFTALPSENLYLEMSGIECGIFCMPSMCCTPLRFKQSTWAELSKQWFMTPEVCRGSERPVLRQPFVLPGVLGGLRLRTCSKKQLQRDGCCRLPFYNERVSQKAKQAPLPHHCSCPATVCTGFSLFFSSFLSILPL